MSSSSVVTPAGENNQNASTKASTVAATTSPATTAAAATPSAQAAAVAGGGAAGTFSSLADLKAKAPVVYKAMMQSIASNICNDSQNWNNMIVEAMQEGEDKNP